MTRILTEAEYERLTDIEKARHWAHRYQDMEIDRDYWRNESLRLRHVVSRIKDEASRA